MTGELSRRQRVGFNVRRGRASRAAELIQKAEAANVAGIWMTMGAQGADTPTLFAAVAAQTERIQLGTSIIPAFTRHPMTLASQALVLDDLAPGRLRLGIGTSHRPAMAGIYGLPFDHPLSRLREYLQVLRPLLQEGEVDFSGEFYTVKGRLPGATKTPVLISALRPNAFETAGALTDGAISWVTPFDYLLEVSRPALERGASEAGREAPPLVAHVSAALTGTRDAAYEAARRELAMYGRTTFYQRMFADAGYPVGSGGEFSDELLGQLVVYGDEDDVAGQLAGLLERGFDELLVMPVPVDDREGEEGRLLDLIGKL